MQGVSGLRDIGAASHAARADVPPPALLCSCDENERSLELDRYGQGLFSIALQKTLLTEKKQNNQIIVNDALLSKIKQQDGKLAG